MGTWIARLHYRLYNRGFGVIIPAGIRISSLYQSIHKGPKGHRDEELFRGFKRPTREFNLLAPELFFLILAHPVYKM